MPRLFRKTKQRAGLAPGTIAFLGEQKVAQVRLRVLDYDTEKLEEREIDVAVGDSLVFYTDAITEAIDPGREPFGEERLEAIVQARADGTAQQVVESIVDAVRAHTGDIPPARNSS